MNEELKKQIKEERRWYARSIIIRIFHLSMQSNYENKRLLKWTVEDSANELNLSVGYISESIKLAKEIEKNALLKFMTREEALKKVRERNE